MAISNVRSVPYTYKGLIAHNQYGIAVKVDLTVKNISTVNGKIDKIVADFSSSNGFQAKNLTIKVSELAGGRYLSLAQALDSEYPQRGIKWVTFDPPVDITTAPVDPTKLPEIK